VSVYVVASNIASFAGDLTSTGSGGQNTYAARLNGLIADVAAFGGIDEAPTLRELFRQLNPQRFLGAFVAAIQGLASDALFILIYLGFLLASRRGFQAKQRALFGSREERREAGPHLRRDPHRSPAVPLDPDRHGRDDRRGLLLRHARGGAGPSVVLGLLHLPDRLYSDRRAGAGNRPPRRLRSRSVRGYGPPLLVFAGNQAVNFFVGNVIYPRMQSRGLNVDSVVVLLSLAFWSALWGITGAFLSTPLTVVAMILLAQFQGSRWIAILLSQDGHPDPHDGHGRKGSPSEEAGAQSGRWRIPGRRSRNTKP
jgi:hypothetical protein